MSLSMCHFRTRLLRIILDKNLSAYTDNAIMNLFENMTEEEKENGTNNLEHLFYNINLEVDKSCLT